MISTENHDYCIVCHLSQAYSKVHFWQTCFLFCVFDNSQREAGRLRGLCCSLFSHRKQDLFIRLVEGWVTRFACGRTQEQSWIENYMKLFSKHSLLSFFIKSLFNLSTNMFSVFKTPLHLYKSCFGHSILSESCFLHFYVLGLSYLYADLSCLYADLSYLYADLSLQYKCLFSFPP